MKDNYNDIRDRIERTFLVNVPRGHFKIKVNRERNLSHKFHVIEKSLYVLIFEFEHDFRHVAANIQVSLEGLFLDKEFIADVALVCVALVFLIWLIFERCL